MTTRSRRRRRRRRGEIRDSGASVPPLVSKLRLLLVSLFSNFFLFTFSNILSKSASMGLKGWRSALASCGIACRHCPAKTPRFPESFGDQQGGQEGL